MQNQNFRHLGDVFRMLLMPARNHVKNHRWQFGDSHANERKNECSVSSYCDIGTWREELSRMYFVERQVDPCGLPRPRSCVSDFSGCCIKPDGHCCHGHDNRHIWSDLGRFLPHAGPLLGLRGRKGQPHLPEHPRADGLSGHCHAAVHVHGVVVQQHCVILNYCQSLIKNQLYEKIKFIIEYNKKEHVTRKLKNNQ